MTFDNEDLLGLETFNYTNESKPISYYEIEKELNETKSKIQQLEEKIEGLLRINTNNIICITTHKEYNFININCNNITFSYDTPLDTQQGFIVCIDDVKLYSKMYTFNNIIKFINQLKNIDTIHIDFRFPLPGNHRDSRIPSYFEEHFNMIKKLIEININITLNISITTISFPFHWLEDLFADIKIKNIQQIKIYYQNRQDMGNTKRLKEVLTQINKKIYKKIILNVCELNL